MKSRNSELLKLYVNEQTALWLWVVTRSRLQIHCFGIPRVQQESTTASAAEDGILSCRLSMLRIAVPVLLSSSFYILISVLTPYVHLARSSV